MDETAIHVSAMPSFPDAHRILTEAIRDRVFPGAAYGVLLRGHTIAADAAGRFTYEHEAPPVQPETIFDIASVTKVVATTSMAMQLAEHGQLDLDAPVGEHLPEFIASEPPNSAKRQVTANMLLAHSSGLPAYARLFETCGTAEELLRSCMKMPLESPPNSRAVYSDIGFIVLGQLLEKIAKGPLDAYCHREIFAPLGMASTMFRPPAQLRSVIPPTQIDTTFRHRVIQCEVQDENCWVLGGVSGHAGVFSNVPDLLRFAGCMLHGGSPFRPEAAPLFQSQTVRQFTARQTMPPGTSRALGWDTPSAQSSSGRYLSSHSAGHLGYTGTSLWIDFERELAVVLLTNRTYSGDIHSSGANSSALRTIQQVRPAFHDAVLRQLGLDLNR